MSYIAYAQYYIYFRDTTEFNAAIATYGADFIAASPYVMASLFGITEFGNTLADKGIVSFQYSLSEPGTEIKNPEDSGLFMSPSVGAVTVPAQHGGVDDLILRWSGIIVKAPSNAIPTSLSTKRRFGGGFEVAMIGEGGSGLSASRSGCRDASRFADGMGWAIRNETGVSFNRTLAEYGTVTNASQSWERMYIRVRTIPSAATNFWLSVGNPSSNAGILVGVNTDLTLRVQVRNSGGAITSSGNSTTVLTLDKWYRLDVLIKYNLASGSRLYINKTLEVDLGGPPTTSHISSTLGDVSGGGMNGLEIDVDTWENSEYPDTDFDAIDWINGIRYQRLNNLSGTITDWTPDQIQSLNQSVSPLGSTTNSRYTSTTALARIEALTDLLLKTQIPGISGIQIGVIYALISLYASRVSADGELGYKLAGGADVLSSITQSTSTIFNTVAYKPSGALTLVEASPFSVVHEKGNSADSSTVLALQAEVALVGLFDLVDGLFSTFNRVPLNHNSATPESEYGYSGPYPNGNCCSFGTTYDGNDTTQEVTLPFPPHFIIIRNIATTAAANGPAIWWSSGISGHFGGTDTVRPENAIRVYVNSSGVVKIIVSGSDSMVNASGSTYQLTAFCDPGMRYVVNGAWRHQTSLASAVNALQNGLFTPEFCFAQSDNLNQTSSIISTTLKGSGNSANAGQAFDGTAKASLMTFALGSITSLANAHIGSSQVSYSAWRTVDGSGYVAVQILNYTGNGVNPRTITLTPTSGKVPLLVIVQAVSGALHFRDASHTGSNCSRYDLFQVTTGITAMGVDSITVNSTLNSNGIVYNVFVICGDATTVQNGTFYAPSILPPTDAWFGSIAILDVDDVSGIYTLVPNKRNDTYWTRNNGVDTEDVKIPDPFVETGFVDDSN